MPVLSLVNAYKSLFLPALCSCLIGCGGTKILKEPVPFIQNQPLAVSNTEQLSISLDWVIVRDGPGTWAKNADWDEYLMRIENTSAAVVTVQNVVAYDSTLTPHQALGERKALVAASKQTAHRYAGQGVEVKAGLGAGALLAAGMIGGTAAVGAGAAAVYMSSAAAATAVGVLLAAPALVVGGVVKSVNQSRVNDQIMQRQAMLPLTLDAGISQEIHLFYPLVPSPAKLEMTYLVSDEQVERILQIELGSQLDGLHLKP